MTFWHEIETFGDRIALLDGAGTTLSYADLAGAADALTPDRSRRHLVLLPMANRIAAITAYVAALRAGWPVIIINDGDETAAARMLEVFRPGLRWIEGSGFVATGLDDPTADLHADLAVLLSTSGTTGSTKLVRLSATAVDANARSIGEYLGLTPDERAITTLPPSYSYGLSVLNSHLATGASLVLFDGSVIEEGFRATIDTTGATSFAGVPYTYELLERTGFFKALPTSLRMMTQAGGRMPADRIERVAALAQAAGKRLFIMYGQTEATARMSYLPPERLPELSGCIGYAIPRGQFTLVDPETGAPDAQSGELVYSGPNVMMGYAEQAADLARGPEVERLHTGDLAEQVEPGLFRIVGRKSRFIKMFGLRLSLDEVEKEAARHGQTIVATGSDELLVLACEQGAAEPSILSLIAARYELPEAQIAFWAYDQLPRLASGKVDYRTITSEATPTPLQAPLAEGGDALEAIRAIFRRSFPARQISDDDSFLSLDGDSLTYINFVLGVETLLGPLPEGWETMSLRQLAALAPTGGKRASFVTIEPNVFVRAAAPLMVVANHAHFTALSGGAVLLMMVAGQNFGKFGLGELGQGRAGKVLRTFAISVLIPYWLILVGYQVLRRDVSLPDVFLVNNFLGMRHIEPFETWFIQALFHAVLLMAALSLIPAVRTGLREKPERTVLGILFAGAAVGLIQRLFLMDILDNWGRETSYVFWLFALGLCVGTVTSRAGKLTVLAVTVVMAFSLYSSDTSRLISVIAGMALLLSHYRVPVPRLLIPVLTIIGSSSMFIYMMHSRAPVNGPTAHWNIDIIRVVIGVVLGIVTYLIYDWVAMRIRRFLARAKPDAAAGGIPVAGRVL